MNDSTPTGRARYVTRRNVLAISAALAVPAYRSWPAAALPGFDLTEIAPGIFVHQGRHETFSPNNAGDIANCCFVVGDTAVAVIDTGGSRKVGDALRAAITNVTDRPVKYVINTHMHPDHVFGNAAFAHANGDNPTFAGHTKLARALSLRAQRYLETNKASLGPDAFKGTAIIPPTMQIEKPTKIDLGGRQLELRPQQTAHTDNDLIVYDDKTDTLFLGDLLFSGHLPTLDGSITGWIKLLDQLATQSAARVVPGHGPPAMKFPDALQPISNYLRTVAENVRAMIAHGKTMQEAVTLAGDTPAGDWLLFEEYHRRNVTAAFAELEWE